MTVQVKCSQATFLSKWIVVTTTKKPNVLFACESGEDLAQLTRRIDHVIEFPLNALTQIQLANIMDVIRNDCSDPLDILLDGVAPEAVPTLNARLDLNEPLVAPTAEEDFLLRQASATSSALQTSVNMSATPCFDEFDFDLLEDYEEV